MLNIFSSIPIKAIIILTLLSTLSGLYLWDRERAYKAGYNEAKALYTQEANVALRANQEVTEASIAAINKKLIDKQTEADNNKNKVVQLQALLDKKPTTIEVIREIQTVTSSCDLGDDYWRVQHSIIGEAPAI